MESVKTASSLAALQARRLRLHRLDPSRPLPNARSAAAFVRERGMVMTTGHSSLPSLSEGIAGRPISGSWMATPDVHRIYAILRGLRAHDLVEAPLILGKAVLMHPRLGPALQRVARDPGRCEKAREELSPLARRLLQTVEVRGAIRMDAWGPAARSRPARTLLERELLVVADEVHTEGGYHTVNLRPWRTGQIAARFERESRHLAYDEAAEILFLAAVHAAVTAPEREARRWFAFGGDLVDALLTRKAIRRLRDRGIPYVVAGRSTSTRC
ncbi:MAG TPA: hypothetical protein VGR25_09045 [bacterium]|jgi:hypothetical protein|nr:hypothetical protein [bacterium]